MRSPRYDEWHFQRWKGKDGKAPQRTSEYKVFNSIAQSYRQRLCTRLSLPKAVKDIFQRPKDEDDWCKLEQFRRALLRIVEGEELSRYSQGHVLLDFSTGSHTTKPEYLSALTACRV